MEKSTRKSAIVIGGGLVGSLAAIFMIKRGYDVQVYEKREDCRNSEMPRGRSINLSLSHRGRQALKMVGLEEEVLQNAVPMVGRLIHAPTGETKSIPYDRINNQCLYSICRNRLNILLIKALTDYQSCKLFFNHKFIKANLAGGDVTFLNTKTNEVLTSAADIIIAADGAFSNVRCFIQNTSIFTFSQSYIDTGYLELTITNSKGSTMIPNHLHIWPRGDFMMIALPNADESWTVTLFMPFKNFEALKSPEKVISFFKKTFPDYFDFTSEEALVKEFFIGKPMPLVSVKCDPYHHAGKLVLIGDAAHAMVPFYGQGMNAGFEDCYMLGEILEETEDDVAKSIEIFTERRRENAHAICDLAMYNYVEMRSLITKKSFVWRKRIDEILFKMFPRKWIPLYNSVTFSNMGYQECMKNREYQNKVIIFFGVTALAVLVTGVYMLLYNNW